jgi:hypothetical protein
MTFEEWLDTGAERSPPEYFHGLYVRDATNFGGAAAFSWFRDDAEALAFLRDCLVLLYLDANEDAGQVQAIRGAITAALQGVRTLKAVDLDAVNDGLAGFCALAWAGSLDDLWTGEAAFEKAMQDDFRRNTWGEERGRADSHWHDFVDHLSHYNG